MGDLGLLSWGLRATVLGSEGRCPGGYGATVLGDVGPPSRGYGTHVLSSWGCCSWGLELSSGGYGVAVPGLWGCSPGALEPPAGFSHVPPAPGMPGREQPGPAAGGEAGGPFKKVEARKFIKVEKVFRGKEGEKK